MAYDTNEYLEDVYPSESQLEQLRLSGADVFMFVERDWCFNYADLPSECVAVKDNVALLSVETYAEWLADIKRRTHHNPLQRALNKGVEVRAVNPDLNFALGIYQIYNETPVRQNRSFNGYGASLDAVSKEILTSHDLFVGAYYENALVGFIQLVKGDDTLLISQILSLAKYANKSINKALIAKAVELCSSLNRGWIVYARMGNHPSLDRFKTENGFKRYNIKRYYIPLTWKGKLAILLGLHRSVKDLLPERFKMFVLPVFNWFSRVRLRF